MERQVQNYIKRHGLLSHSGRYLVAVSGGADSVALLLLLQTLGYQTQAVHCNFHLRGEESERDEQFVVELCEQLQIPLHRIHFDTREYASLHKISIEMAARELRYRYFEQLRCDLQMDGICVAHHRDDSVETVLINMIRGTGLHGLAGIRPRQGYILRPLLCVSRKQIENYLLEKQQKYVTDTSNLVPDVMRNQIRLNVMPQLAVISPSAAEQIQKTAERVADALPLYDEAVRCWKQEAVGQLSADTLSVPIERLTSETLLFELLRDYGFIPAQVEQIYVNLTAATGSTFTSGDYELLLDRGRLLVERRSVTMKPTVIPEAGTYVLPDERRLRLRQVAVDSTFRVSKAKECIHLDALHIQFPLTLRPVTEGDWFVPYGMTGRKLISDYLTDRKVNLLDKRKALVVCDATNAVLWLVGYRTDHRYRVSDATTTAFELSFPNHSSTRGTPHYSANVPSGRERYP